MNDDDALAAARDAFERHDWQQAYRALQELDEGHRLAAEDLERLADAARWTGRYDELPVVLERAHTAYAGQGANRGAARLALALCRFQYEQNNSAAANGWWMRAARELEGVPECREHGLLQWMLAHTCYMEGDLDGVMVVGVTDREDLDVYAPDCCR